MVSFDFDAMESFLKSLPPVNVSGFQRFLESFQTLKENFRLIETAKTSAPELEHLRIRLTLRLEEIEMNLKLKRKAAKRAKVDYFVESKEWEAYTLLMEELCSESEGFARVLKRLTRDASSVMTDHDAGFATYLKIREWKRGFSENQESHSSDKNLLGAASEILGYIMEDVYGEEGDIFASDAARVKMNSKLGEFQRTQFSHGVSGTECETHEKKLQVLFGPVIDRAANGESEKDTSYLSYAVSYEDNTIRLLFGEQGSTKKQLISVFNIEGNKIKLVDSKFLPNKEDARKIAMSNGQLFAAVLNENGIGEIQQIDCSTLKNQGELEEHGTYEEVQCFLLIGTPDMLIAMECKEQNVINYTIIQNDKVIKKEQVEIPLKIKSFRSFYHGDYLFHANEHDNDLIAVKWMENGNVLDKFKKYHFNLANIGAIHSIMGIDIGAKIYLVAVQLRKLNRIMIYELNFNRPDILNPAIALIQEERLDFKIMALIRTAKRDKLVFVTTDEKMGIMELKELTVK
ncbi:uncharacterized protein LOC134844176 isoform X2 [Symsagittifera roscoffensis]|uniref:uncharacterized protein LOC134844176 isoform X2 n=1 Tax=Symsagittifera roscoffensis TaxID=84072 RepID=UPI00307B2A24